jgi:hypothetical protein
VTDERLNKDDMFDFADKITPVKRCFPPCQRGDSLLQNFPRAASGAAIGSRIWFSPVGSSFEHFRNCKFPGGFLCHGVKSISGGVAAEHPKIRGKSRVGLSRVPVAAENEQICHGLF